MTQPSASTNQSSPPETPRSPETRHFSEPLRPTGPIVGIWRLGDSFHAGNWAQVSACQPADAVGSPRFDYVIKQASDSTIQARSQITAQVAAASQTAHPNLVPVLDASTEGAKPYLVMPRIDGQTMSHHLGAGEAKALPVALWLIRQVSQGLEALHQTGWIHGDVKPENILVSPRGHVTLIDLGLATKVHTVSQNQFRGTVDYASPESLTGQFAALPSMDIFSLGRILWQWMARTQPVSQIYLEPVAELVEAMIAETPADRPSASEVVKRLLRLEIETLGRHIGPGESPNNARRAA